MTIIKSSNFRSYLAGLLEGDGSFVVPSNLRDFKGRQRYAKIRVAFVRKDKPLAETLKSCYGGNFEEQDNYIVWNITSQNQILSLCHDINGYLRTPKFNDFYKLINFIKTQTKHVEFEVLPLDDTSPIDSSAWLSGFSDADSNFSISITNRRSNKKRIQISFRIEVKQYYKKPFILKNSENYSSFVPICNTIASHFGLGFYHRTRHNKHHLILIASTSLESNSKVINYFEKFPLFSSKYLDYVNWKSIYMLQKKKLHLTAEGLQTCEEIKKNHNKTRHTFNWDHLANFFTN